MKIYEANMNSSLDSQLNINQSALLALYFKSRIPSKLCGRDVVQVQVVHHQYHIIYKQKNCSSITSTQNNLNEAGNQFDEV